MVKRIAVFLFIVCFSAFSQADANASITRDRIALDETFLVVFDVEGKDIDTPDFSVLEKDFNIVGQSSSSTTQIINFNRTEKHQWKLHLMPKKAGRLKIPPVSFGKHQSQALYIAVEKEAKPKTNIKDLPIFIESEVSTQQAWVQQEIVYTLRLFNAIPGAEPRNIDKMDIPDSIITTLDPITYQKQVSGMTYNVYEFRYYIYPQKSGAFEIPSLKISTAIPYNTSQSRFFRQQAYSEEILRSRKISIDVMAVDAELKVNPWLPAEELFISDNLDSIKLESLQPGDTISREITLSASGTMAEFLPDLPENNIQGLKVYPEKPVYENKASSDNNNASKTVRQEILVSQGGDFVLPEINIDWLDVNSGKKQTATLPARYFSVKGPAPAVNQAGNKQTPAKMENNNTAVAINATDNKSTLLLVFSLLANGLLLLLVVFLFRKRQHESVIKSEINSNANNKTPTSEKLLAACRANDKLATRHLIGCLARESYGCSSADQLGNPELQGELALLDKAIAEQSNWHGEKLADVLQQLLKAGNKKEKAADLPPLYPK